MNKTVAEGAFGSPDFFEATPMSLWLEDYSAVYEQFQEWRSQGITCLREWLQDKGHLSHCISLVRILRVNSQTLNLFEADSAETLMAHLSEIIPDDAATGFIDELEQLWRGENGFKNQTTNYTLQGKRLDLSLKARLLTDAEKPWDRVLVAMEDITPLQTARREAHARAREAREFFQQAPVSLWVEDFSAIKLLLDDLRQCGIVDFRTFLNVHDDFIDRCQDEIRVCDVNDYTLALFKAKSYAELTNRMHEILDEDSRASFKEQLIDLWEGQLFQQKEVHNRTLDGDALYLHLQLSIFDGCEDDWSQVLIALTDITARKKAEAYLEYLGQHDVLTQLKNRAYFADELKRLARRRTPLVSLIVLDLNGLKCINDEGGHAAGDDILRRLGEILKQATDDTMPVARIGGDEFIVLLPARDEAAAQEVLANIHTLTALNNQYHGAPYVSVSVGTATCRDPDRLEQAIGRADRNLYMRKQEFYALKGNERRASDDQVGSPSDAHSAATPDTWQRP